MLIIIHYFSAYVNTEKKAKIIRRKKTTAAILSRRLFSLMLYQSVSTSSVFFLRNSLLPVNAQNTVMNQNVAPASARIFTATSSGIHQANTLRFLREPSIASRSSPVAVAMLYCAAQ